MPLPNSPSTPIYPYRVSLTTLRVALQALLLDTQSAAVRRLQKLHGVGRGGGANAGAAENSGLRFLERRVGEGGFVEYLVEPAPQVPQCPRVTPWATFAPASLCRSTFACTACASTQQAHAPTVETLSSQEVIIAVRIPHDAQPGSVMQLQLQGNGQATVMIPEGASPGATLSVKVRAFPTAPPRPSILMDADEIGTISSFYTSPTPCRFQSRGQQPHIPKNHYP